MTRIQELLFWLWVVVSAAGILTIAVAAMLAVGA
jgi:hypothetical protein